MIVSEENSSKYKANKVAYVAPIAANWAIAIEIIATKICSFPAIKKHHYIYLKNIIAYTY